MPPEPTLTARYDDALAFASRIHRAQRRKGSEVPYIAHLLAVSALVLEHGATENEAIAALLHDAVEDQGGSQMSETICSRFGGEVAEIVRGCTDTDEIHKPSWRPRKERFLARLEDAPFSVRLVVTADKLHNVRSILDDYRLLGEDLWQRFTGGREGTLWYYRAVVEVLRDRLGDGEHRLGPLTEKLADAVSELEALACQSTETPTRTMAGT